MRNGSILEVLVNDALKGAVTTNIYHNPTPGSAIPGDISLEKTRSPHAQHNQHRQDRSEDEDSISEDGEDDDVNYSQIEEADAPFADSTSSSAAASPAKLTAPAKGETGSESKLYHPDAKASPPALHSIFHQHSNSKMDESSSFEADSPARPVSSHAATTAPPKFAATVLEDSFVEELEENTSVEEEIAEEQEENDAKLSAVDGSKSTSAPVYPDKIADETKPQFKYAPADSDGDGNMGEGEDGPEYESDRGSEAKDDSQSPIVAASAREGHKPFSDSDSGSDSGRSTRSGGASGSLRPAVADDFDPLDRDTSREGVPAAGHSHHSVAVRRAAAEAAESKNSPDSAPGAKASVFRLGQVGWLFDVSIAADGVSWSQLLLLLCRVPFQDPSLGGVLRRTTAAWMIAAMKMTRISFTLQEMREEMPGAVFLATRRCQQWAEAPAILTPTKWRPFPSTQTRTSTSRPRSVLITAAAIIRRARATTILVAGGTIRPDRVKVAVTFRWIVGTMTTMMAT